MPVRCKIQTNQFIFNVMTLVLSDFVFLFFLYETKGMISNVLVLTKLDVCDVSRTLIHDKKIVTMEIDWLRPTLPITDIT